MAKKIPLAPKRKQWAVGRNVTLNGTRLNYNASIQLRYQKSIYALLREMTQETKEEVIKLFSGGTAQEYEAMQQKAAAMDAEGISMRAKKLMTKLQAKFSQLFENKAYLLSKKMFEETKNYSESSLSSSLKTLTGGLTLKTGVVPKGLEQVSQSIIAENVELISSIPSRYYTDVTGSVMRSITKAGSLSELTDDIQKAGGVSRRRAKNIAIDQTNKAYNFVNRYRMQSLGVKQFKWVHSGGGREPRKSHQAMSGEIFSFDDLPVINQEQVDRGYEAPERGIPGQAINCRCTMIPVVVFDDDAEE